MKHINIFFAVLGALMLVLVGCSENSNITGPVEQPVQTDPVTLTTENVKLIDLTESSVFPLRTGKNIIVGSVQIKHDGEYYYVVYKTFNGWKLQQTQVHAVSNIRSLPLLNDAVPDPAKFSHVIQHGGGVEMFTHFIPRKGMDVKSVARLFVVAHADLTSPQASDFRPLSVSGWGGYENGSGSEWWSYISYDLKGETSGEIVTGEEITNAGNEIISLN